MPVINKTAFNRLTAFLDRQRTSKRVMLLDLGMERVQIRSCADVLARTQPQIARPLTPENIREADMSRVVDHTLRMRDEPLQGAGGLGIISQAINSSPLYFGDRLGFRLVSLSLLFKHRRVQTIGADNRQGITNLEIDPSRSSEYSYLGDLVTTRVQGKDFPTEVWMYEGYREGEEFTPALCLRIPGYTDTIYPDNTSMELLNQMIILGQGGFKLAQFLGLAGTKDPQANLVIGHDGHTSLFFFNMLLWNLEQLCRENGKPEQENKDEAIQRTRKLCAQTIHAPQIGTVPRFSRETFLSNYTESQWNWWCDLGMDVPFQGHESVEIPGQNPNALFAAIQLCFRASVGFVSPLHKAVTHASEDVRRRDPRRLLRLLPNDVDAAEIGIHHDTVDLSWVGPGFSLALDKHFPFWRTEPERLIGRDVINQAFNNWAFMGDFADALESQDIIYTNLLREYRSRGMLRYEELPEGNAVYCGSLRRATEYKVRQIISLLDDNGEMMRKISKYIGRPMFWLFGGMAHPADAGAIEALRELTEKIGKVNATDQAAGKRDRGQGSFTANMFIGYEYPWAVWNFQGMALRGMWVGASGNPLSGSQGTEAFGPSYLKALFNSMRIVGPSDGGAGCLRRYPLVHTYGIPMFLAGVSKHRQMLFQPENAASAAFSNSQTFYGSINDAAQWIAEDLDSFEKGDWMLAPWLQSRIRTMFSVIGEYNPTLLMKAYVDCARANMANHGTK